MPLTMKFCTADRMAITNTNTPKPRLLIILSPPRGPPRPHATIDLNVMIQMDPPTTQNTINSPK